MHLSLGQMQHSEAKMTHCKFVLEVREREGVVKEIGKFEERKEVKEYSCI